MRPPPDSVPRLMGVARILAIAVATWLPPAGFAAADDDRAAERRRMVEVISSHGDDVGPLAGHAGISERVLDVMATVPRHRFVPSDRSREAYDDRPLPIGWGQTISQPFIVALMSELLDLDGDETVLEIGTGSGYHAAVLGHLARRVHTIEIVPALADAAAERLADLGYDMVTVRQGDGYHGWPEAGPFDAIIVTAAAPHVPPPLLQQLKEGGRMVIPVGPPFFVQQLILVTRDEAGAVQMRHLLPVRFVPLTGAR